MIPRLAIQPHARVHWPASTFVIPNYQFAINVRAGELRLSHEHTEFRWLPYAEADDLLRYDSNKTALWDLNERLLAGNMPSPVVLPSAETMPT